jgi:hypothetical protein
LPDTIASLEAQLPRQQDQITALRRQYAHTRASAYVTRRHLLERIRAAEKKYDEVLRKLLALNPDLGVGNMYKPIKPKITGGLNIRVEISLDGHAYSNPAPKIPAHHHIWVRAIIDDAHRGVVGVPETHEIAHARWVIGKGYTPLDTIGGSGHDVYFVCNPLVLTREFTAPATGTARNFFVYVDLYKRQPTT